MFHCLRLSSSSHPSSHFDSLIAMGTLGWPREIRRAWPPCVPVPEREAFRALLVEEEEERRPRCCDSVWVSVVGVGAAAINGVDVVVVTEIGDVARIGLLLFG